MPSIFYSRSTILVCFIWNIWRRLWLEALPQKLDFLPPKIVDTRGIHQSLFVIRRGSSFATSISLSLRNQFLLYSVLLPSGVFNWCWPIFLTNYTPIDKVLDVCILRSYRLITLVNTHKSQNSDNERLVLALSYCDSIPRYSRLLLLLFAKRNVETSLCIF